MDDSSFLCPFRFLKNLMCVTYELEKILQAIYIF